MGPLSGVKVIEIAGIGPGPFTAMVLSDMGADVIRVDRAVAARGGDPEDPPRDILTRGRRSVALDLKHPDGVETLLQLVEGADVLIEGFRPGVAERLGFGPDVCHDRNPKLVFGRMTGWGQDGPYALAAGHDINYIALAGALGPIGRATWSGTSAGAGCCWRSASPAPSSRPGPRVRARSSTPRWSTALRCS
jgi:alpha-methylacyl-CoA racemase